MFCKKKKCVFIIVKFGIQEDKFLENEDCLFNCIVLYFFIFIFNKKGKFYELYKQKKIDINENSKFVGIFCNIKGFFIFKQSIIFFK